MNRRVGSLAVVTLLVLLAAIPSAQGQVGRKIESVRQGLGLARAVRQVFKQQEGTVSMEEQLRMSFGLVPEASLHTPLEKILERLRVAAGPDAPPARLLISASPGFQAMAAEDGTITLSAGLLRQLRSTDELAAVLAHEYVHIQKRHVERSRLERFKTVWAGLSNIYLDMEHGFDAAQDRSPQERYMRHAVLRELALQGVQAGLVPARTRGQEDEADRDGVALMVAAGFNPLGMVDFLSELEAFEASNPEQVATSPRAGFGQTMARFLTNSRAARRFARKVDSDDLVEGTVEVGITVGELGLSRAQRGHHATSKRVQGVIDLIDERFADEDRPEILPSPWHKGSAGHTYLAVLDRAQQMLSVDEKQGLDIADKEQAQVLREITATPVAHSPLGRYLQLRYRPSGLARDDAIALIERELELPDSLFITHALAMDVISDYGSRERALELHESSMKSFGDSPEMLRYGVRLNRRAGRSEEAQEFLLRCSATGLDSAKLACQQEM